MNRIIARESHQLLRWESLLISLILQHKSCFLFFYYRLTNVKFIVGETGASFLYQISGIQLYHNPWVTQHGQPSRIHPHTKWRVCLNLQHPWHPFHSLPVTSLARRSIPVDQAPSPVRRLHNSRLHGRWQLPAIQLLARWWAISEAAAAVESSLFSDSQVILFIALLQNARAN